KCQRERLRCRRRNPGKFLRGPIPWPWLEAACRLPGKALAVGIVLWQEAGCRKNKTIRFRLSAAVALGMHPDTARRGLRALMKANLVAVCRRPGQSSEVTILAA